MHLIDTKNAEFAKLWSELYEKSSDQDCLFSSSALKYYREYASADDPSKEEWADLSAIVLNEKDKPILGLSFIKHTIGQKSHFAAYGMWSRVFHHMESTSHEIDLAMDQLKNHVTNAIKGQEGFELKYLSEMSTLCSLDLELLNLGAKILPKVEARVDLSPDEGVLKANVRKSFKSLINWGETNIQWNLLYGPTADLTDFMTFRELHIQIAGRETRSLRSWELQFEMIQKQEAFCWLGRIHGKLETASLFFLNGKSCYYAVSASNRDFFDKPLLHAAIWKSMKFAKSQGVQIFNMGEQAFLKNPENSSKKEIDISIFKRGFGGKLRIHHLFVLEG